MGYLTAKAATKKGLSFAPTKDRLFGKWRPLCRTIQWMTQRAASQGRRKKKGVASYFEAAGSASGGTIAAGEDDGIRTAAQAGGSHGGLHQEGVQHQDTRRRRGSNQRC